MMTMTRKVLFLERYSYFLASSVSCYTSELFNRESPLTLHNGGWAFDTKNKKIAETHDEEEFKISSNHLFDLDEDLLLNRDTSFDSSSKIDFLLDEFAGELTRLQSIPPGIDNINLDLEGDIFFLESFLSSPLSPSGRPEIVDSLYGGDGQFFLLFESFHVDYPDSGDSTIDVVEDIPIDVPNILPTHLALQLDFNFIPSLNDLGSDLDVSSPSGASKLYIYDSWDSIARESSSSLSLRGFKASKLFHQKSPMLISGDNTLNLGVRHPHFYPP
ncbi:hypothetical protein Tco_0867266 [Tanacetum coccineum]